VTEEKSTRTEDRGRQIRGTRLKADDNVVFIGQKPVMSYVLACLTLLNSGTNKIVVKARGRAIPRAVDTVEVLRRSFAQGLQLESIRLSTEEVERTEGQKSRVSAIEIAVTKP
jgi:DNA-binding protein